MKNKKILVVLVLLILLSIALIALFLRKPKPKPSLQPDSNASEWEGKQDLEKRKSEIKQIAIPGFDSLVFL